MDAGILQLMRLVSPALPVGAYSYSRGLETAIHAGFVTTTDTLSDWLLGLLTQTLAFQDAPVLARLHAAWLADDEADVERWARFLLASRESRELIEEERDMGQSLSRLLAALGVERAASWQRHPDRSFLAMFALAAVHWTISSPDMVGGYLMSWSENQVAVAVRAVPLGHTDGQRVLSQLIDRIPAATERALSLADDEIGSVATALAIGSAYHETQYSRMFRS